MRVKVHEGGGEQAGQPGRGERGALPGRRIQADDALEQLCVSPTAQLLVHSNEAGHRGQATRSCLSTRDAPVCRPSCRFDCSLGTNGCPPDDVDKPWPSAWLVGASPTPRNIVRCGATCPAAELTRVAQATMISARAQSSWLLQASVAAPAAAAAMQPCSHVPLPHLDLQLRTPHALLPRAGVLKVDLHQRGRVGEWPQSEGQQQQG